MSSEELKTTMLHAFMDAFNNGNLSALDTICAPHMVDHSAAAAPNRHITWKVSRRVSMAIAWACLTCVSQSQT